jgi:cell division protease FtsH
MTPDYSHEIAREIDEEVRNLIEAAHTEAWAILNDYRDVLDDLAKELLERETLHRVDLEKVLSAVEKRPRITTFNDFGERTPSDKPPIKTPAELAAERGEPWPPVEEAPPVTPPQQTWAQAPVSNGYPAYQPTGPNYGAPAGWSAPGWPPQNTAPQPHAPQYPARPQQAEPQREQNAETPADEGK